MKKALMIVSGALVMGSFSFASAAVVYSQPSGSFQVSSAVSSTISAGVNLGTFTATGAHVLTGPVLTSALGFNTSEAGYVCVYNETDGTHIACSDTNTVATSSQAVQTIFTLIAANQSGTTISGKTYTIRLVAGTSGFIGYRLTDSNGTPYVVLTDTSGGVVPPNWGAIGIVPPIDFAAVQYVATSTSFFSGSASGTLQAIANECSSTGNIFSEAMCRAAAYLFVPNPNVTNQYLTLATTTAQKFPFSYVFGISALFTGLTASSTTNMIAPKIAFSQYDPASSTPFGPFLPDLTFLSTSTIQRYMPSGFWSLIQTLMIAAIWLGLAFMLVREALKMANSHHQ